MERDGIAGVDHFDRDLRVFAFVLIEEGGSAQLIEVEAEGRNQQAGEPEALVARPHVGFTR